MMLDVKDVHACYGKSHVLQGISLSVNEGETVTLLGRNGAGKSTTLKTIAGVVAPTGGTVTFAGRSLSSVLLKPGAGTGDAMLKSLMGAAMGSPGGQVSDLAALLYQPAASGMVVTIR